jgi:hypothetical protein
MKFFVSAPLWISNLWFNYLLIFISVIFELVSRLIFFCQVNFFFWWYWDLNSEPIPGATLPALFYKGFFWGKSSWTICLGWLWTAISWSLPPEQPGLQVWATSPGLQVNFFKVWFFRPFSTSEL